MGARGGAPTRLTPPQLAAVPGPGSRDRGQHSPLIRLPRRQDNARVDLVPAGRFEWERLIKRARLGQRAQHIGLLLATYADADGTRVKPGTVRLMSITGMSRSTVCRALAVLRDNGMIEYTYKALESNRKGAVDEYRLTRPVDMLDRIPMLPPEDKPVHLVAHGNTGLSTSMCHG